MNKGFTTVELIVSFALTSVMLLLLFELVVSIRGLYLSSGIKTELLTKQAVMTSKINEDFTNYNILSMSNCGVDCLNIHFEGGLIKQLSVDATNGLLKYGNYVSELIQGSRFLQPTVLTYTEPTSPANNADSYFIIKIVVTHRLYENEDFGVKVLKTYDSRVNPITLANFR